MGRHPASISVALRLCFYIHSLTLYTHTVGKPQPARAAGLVWEGTDPQLHCVDLCLALSCAGWVSLGVSNSRGITRMKYINLYKTSRTST